MNRFILIIAAAAMFYVNKSHGQSFREPLLNTFLAFDTTRDFQTKMEQSNKLSLISKRYSDEWSVHYYNAYSKAQLSYMETDEAKRDAFLEEAEKERDEALALLKKDNDETYVLSAMIANARLAVKPQSRWQKYGKIFDENLKKAKEINPENPRIYYLQGTSKFFTPKMFGGGKKAALPYFEKAEGLFAKEKGDDITKPSWGKYANKYFLGQAKGEEED